MTMYRLNSVPTNVGALPIIKGGSPNIWDEEWEVGDIAYATGANISGSSWIRSTNYIPIHSKTSYFMRCKVSNNCNLYFYDANKTYLGQNTGGLITAINNVAFNTPANSYYMRFATQTSFEDNTFSINYPANLTGYYPHNQPIVTFNTDLAEKLVSLLVEVKATQSGSGTPSPSNPRLINGFSACDVTNAEKYIRVTPTIPQTYSQNGIDITTYANGKITINGTATANTYIEIDCVDFTIFTESSRTIRFNNDCVGLTVYFYDGASSFDSWNLSTINRTYTDFVTSSGKHTTSIRIGINSGVTINNGSLMIEFIVTDTATTHTINFGQTVYGGRLNVGSGVLTVTHECTTVGSMGWGVGDYFYSSISDKAVGNFNIISDNYATTTSPSASGMGNWEIKGNATTNSIYLKDSRYSTVTDLINNMGSTLLVYELATPFIIQLDSKQIQAIIGTNNVYCDTGDTEVNYWVTIDKYIGS